MKLSTYRAIAACLTLAAAAPASAQANRGQGASPSRPSHAVPAAGAGALQTRGLDRDQGDEHASQNAIEKVCDKDTPAAQHAAICAGPISRG